jgi:hypothetical protein
MSNVTIRNTGSRAGAVTLGDLKRGDYFVFANSTKDVPNLYQVHEGQYSRKKTGKLFDINPSPSAKGSPASDRVYKVNVDMQYAWA